MRTQLRAAQRRLDVARKNLVIEQDLQSLTASLLAAGLAPEQDLLCAQAQVFDIEAAIPQFATHERSAMYRIAALMSLSTVRRAAWRGMALLASVVRLWCSVLSPT